MSILRKYRNKALLSARINSFTLVEIVVALVVIGVLSAAVINTGGNQQARARDSSRIADMLLIQHALETYKMDQGAYPISRVEKNDYATAQSPLIRNLTKLNNIILLADTNNGQGSWLSLDSSIKNIEPILRNYMKEVPTDPIQGLKTIANGDCILDNTSKYFAYYTYNAGEKFYITSVKETKKGNTNNCGGVIDANKNGEYEVVGNEIMYGTGVIYDAGNPPQWSGSTTCIGGTIELKNPVCLVNGEIVSNSICERSIKKPVLGSCRDVNRVSKLSACQKDDNYDHVSTQVLTFTCREDKGKDGSEEVDEELCIQHKGPKPTDHGKLIPCTWYEFDGQCIEDDTQPEAQIICKQAISGGGASPVDISNCEQYDLDYTGLLASHELCDDSNPMDIVLEVTIGEENQTLTINKYFNLADYKVDRGDESAPEINSSSLTHQFESPGTYEVTLKNPGGRWRFENGQKPLVPREGTTADNVKILAMPSLADGFGYSASNAGPSFFAYFNQTGALTSLPQNSFDTSSIRSVGNEFFHHFNDSGALESLPDNSFNISGITDAKNNFFAYFNQDGALESLPDGSFDTSSITSVSYSFFRQFNANGALESLPKGSFDISGIAKAESNFFSRFNKDGALESLPKGSFDTSTITEIKGFFFDAFNWGGALESLPKDSFNISNIAEVKSNFFSRFNSNGALKSLPRDSFDTSNITSAATNFFDNFNSNGALESLPKDSFNISNIAEVKSHFFYFFNYAGALKSLPSGSFDTTKITNVGDAFFAYFNQGGALKSLPSGSFDTSNITSVRDRFFRSFNEHGALKSLPSGSFDTSSITSADDYFFFRFNYAGALKSLPSGSFDTSNITSVGNYFFSQFNSQGALAKSSGGVQIKNITNSSVSFNYKDGSSQTVDPGGYSYGYAMDSN